MRVNSTELQNSFGKYLSLVEKEDIIVLKNGKSVAKMIKYNDSGEYFVSEGAGKYKTGRVSYKEYLELVKSSDKRYELIDGKIYLMSSPSFQHQLLVNEISWQLNNYFRDIKECISLTSPLDIKLSGYAPNFEENPNIVQPDLVVICDQENVNKDKYEGTPSLIIEVLSPTTKSKDLVLKLNLYMKSGIKEYWIVDKEKKKIMQYIFTENREIDQVNDVYDNDKIISRYFEGLKINLLDIFEVIK